MSAQLCWHLLLALSASLIFNAALVSRLASSSRCGTVSYSLLGNTSEVGSTLLDRRLHLQQPCPIERSCSCEEECGPTATPQHEVIPSPLPTPGPLVPKPPSLMLAVARHIENIEWLDRLKEDLNGTLQHRLLVGLYQTPGEEIYEKPTAEQLAAAEAAEAAADADVQTPLEAGADAMSWTQPGMHILWRYPPMNRGHEAMGYLTAIIDNYNSLPDLMVAIHAHRFSSHNHFTTDWVLRHLLLRPPAELPESYMSLQCKDEPYDWNMIYPSDINATEPGFRQQHLINILEGWEEFFGYWLGLLPDKLLTPANAEFIVSRAAIQSRPLEFYRATRQWLMVTPLPAFVSAMVMEYLWQLIFTGEAVAWASQEECMCRLYGVCLDKRKKK